MIKSLRLVPLAPLLITALCAVGSSGCYVGVASEPPVVTSAEVEGGDVVYEPAYYDGYVVYYDDGGRPYYYDRGAVVWVSSGSPYYVGLVNHWHYYGRGYGRWYAHEGYRYHAYRGRPGYHAYHGYGRAGGGYHRR